MSPLGAGGMGEVYRARDPRLGREVALKVLPEALAQDPDRLSRFEREARAASALNHPNIVTIHEIGREGETAYIAMELVEGRTLRDLAASGPLPVKRILAIASQVAEGLAKAHAAGIVHRDLKPENVMVSKDGFVKILDFGLAKLVEPPSGEMSAMPTIAPETQPGTVMGTVAYMSPEQASGEPLDFRSDQFSLGSILYEVAAGRKAFQKKTAAETMAAIIREEPEPLGPLRPELPLPVRWMVERCLAKDPEERYASTRDLARDLASVRDRIGEIAGGSGALPASPASHRGRRVPAIAVGVVLMAAAVLAGWLLRGRAVGPASPPRFTRLTFRQGIVGNARIAPDGRTVVYGARWAGDPPGTRLYRTQIGSPESAKFDFPADILAISPSSELAILQQPPSPMAAGTLARVPFGGGTPRQVLEGVSGADFSPDGRELAVVHSVDGKDRLEFPIGKVLAEGGIEAPRVSPDGRLVAFWEDISSLQKSAEVGMAVSIVGRDGAGKRVLSAGWKSMGGTPCWSADGRELWFTANEQNGKPSALWAVDLDGRRRLLLRPPGSLELDDIGRNGTALLAHHTAAQSVRFASASEPGERELAWLDGSRLVDLSPDGKTVLLTEVGEGAGPGPVIYLRGTDGSPAVRIGDGEAFALSPDGKWVLALSPSAGKPSALTLLPTGPGQPAPLPGTRYYDRGADFEDIAGAAFLPDGRRIVYTAQTPDGSWRTYVQAIPGGKPEAIRAETLIVLPESSPVSPDGKFLIARRRREAILVRLDGAGPDRVLPGLAPPEDWIPQWSADSRHLYVYRLGEVPQKVWLYDVGSGERRLWKEIPVDPVTQGGGFRMRMTPDGAAWATQTRRISSQLYAVEGLR